MIEEIQRVNTFELQMRNDGGLRMNSRICISNSKEVKREILEEAIIHPIICIRVAPICIEIYEHDMGGQG